MENEVLRTVNCKPRLNKLILEKLGKIEVKNG